MTADEGSARQTLSVADLEAWVRRSAELISEHAEELTELDAAIGDADHGTNMTRGLAAAVDAVGAGGFTAADALLTGARGFGHNDFKIPLTRRVLVAALRDLTGEPA